MNRKKNKYSNMEMVRHLDHEDKRMCESCKKEPKKNEGKYFVFKDKKSTKVRVRKNKMKKKIVKKLIKNYKK